MWPLKIDLPQLTHTLAHSLINYNKLLINKKSHNWNIISKITTANITLDLITFIKLTQTV